MDRISWLDQPPETGWQGVFLANEVLDALTVERFCIETDGIKRLMVDNGPDGFEWHKGLCKDKMREQVHKLLEGLDKQPTDGYCSEICIDLPAWLEAVTGSLTKGVALFIDYGYTRSDYYLAERRDGTLICHYQQYAHDDPFLWPGLVDISSSVDFTALAEAADDCGLEVSGYTTQAMFLLANGLGTVIAESADLPLQDRLKMSSQVRRLTMPGEMGERFQVMALCRGLDEDFCESLQGFALSDLRHRL